MHYCFLNLAIEFYSPVSGGAIATIIRHAARELLRRGHRVTVLTRVDANPTYDVGEVIPLAFVGSATRGVVRRAAAVLEQNLHGWEWTEYGAYRRAFTAALRALPEPPDVVFVFNDFVSSRYLKGLLPKVRTVVWLQNECRPRRNLAGLVGWTDRFLTCSDYLRDWTIRTLGLPPTRVATVPSGVDLGAFTPREATIGAEAPRVLRALFVGRIDRNKGPDLAADAVATLRAEGADVRLTVAGGLWFYGHGQEEKDPFFRELRGKLDAIGGTYLGHVEREQMPGVMRAHNVVFVLSRSQEPFGLVVLEAMASGCAVIASDRGGLPEACGGAAMLVDPEDPAAVAGCLRALATDPAALQTYRERSLRRAAAGSWSNCVETLITAVSGPRRGPESLTASSARLEPLVARTPDFSP